MGRIKVLTIAGTRPEAIKLGPLILEFARRRDQFVSKVCLTAQHRDMADQVLALFGVKPDYDLDVMSPGQTLAQVTSRAVERLDEVVLRECPDIIIVQGDTTSAMCGALVGYYSRRMVGHVEAGLRTGNKHSPFPEEINRRLVAQLADFHFVPTESAGQALLREGVSEDRVFLTGNTVIDALLWVRERTRQVPVELPAGVLAALEGHTGVLVTGHRRESFGEGFENICVAIREVADLLPDVVFFCPVHLNPNVQGPVRRILADHPRIFLLEPLSYAPFVWLMDHTTLVLTDSGGVQEEAPSLGKPVLVTRETTERPEGVIAGHAILVGVEKARIADALVRLLQNPSLREKMVSVANPYGDGHAAERIADILVERVGVS